MLSSAHEGMKISQKIFRHLFVVYELQNYEFDIIGDLQQWLLFWRMYIRMYVCLSYLTIEPVNSHLSAAILRKYVHWGDYHIWWIINHCHCELKSEASNPGA